MVYVLKAGPAELQALMQEGVVHAVQLQLANEVCTALARSSSC